MKKRLLLAIMGLALFVLTACGAGQTAALAPTQTPVPAEQPTAALPTPTPAAEPAASNMPVAEETAAVTESTTSTEAAEPEPPAAETAGEMAAPAAEIRTFVIVPEQSQASYIVAEEFFGGALNQLGIQPGLVDTIGVTQEVSGEMQLNLNDPAAPLVSNQFSVNLQSLTSDQSRRDNQIRQRWLESNSYPLAEFTITSLENLPASYPQGQEVTFQANGDITIRDITRPVTFDVTASFAGDTITGVATTQLKMTDFGFPPPNFANLFSVADDFTAQVEFTFQAR